MSLQYEHASEPLHIDVKVVATPLGFNSEAFELVSLNSGFESNKEEVENSLDESISGSSCGLATRPPVEPQTSIAVERVWNNTNGSNDFHLKDSSSQGQNLALTVLHVPRSLDSGHKP